jgi:hypothetical protein
MNVLAMNAREKIAKAMIVREMTEDSKTKQYPLAHKSKGIFFASVIMISPRWGYDDCTPSEAEGWGYCDCTPSEAEGWG